MRKWQIQIQKSWAQVGCAGSAGEHLLCYLETRLYYVQHKETCLEGRFCWGAVSDCCHPGNRSCGCRFLHTLGNCSTHTWTREGFIMCLSLTWVWGTVVLAMPMSTMHTYSVSTPRTLFVVWDRDLCSPNWSQTYAIAWDDLMFLILPPLHPNAPPDLILCSARDWIQSFVHSRQASRNWATSQYHCPGSPARKIQAFGGFVLAISKL